MNAAIYARKSTDQSLPDAEKSVTRQVEHATEQAVQVAMEAARKTLAGSSARRAAIDRELRTLAGRVGRLTEAVAAGTGATAPLLEKLAAEEARRGALVREHAALDASAKTIDLTSEKILRAIRQRANDIRGALLTHREEAAEILRAFVSRIDCTPFGSGRGRGYRFKGRGDYGALFGENFPTRGVPDGIRRLVAGSRIFEIRGGASAA